MPKFNLIPAAAGILIVGLLLVFPAVVSGFYLQLLSKMMIMAIFAMSLNLLVGFAGLISFGHAAFFGLGAYALFVLSPQHEAASLWTSLPIAVAVTTAGALLIGFLVLRSTGVYFIMSTLALSQMLFYYVADAKWLGGSDGAYVYFKPDATLFGFSPFDLEKPMHFYYVLLTATLGVCGLLWVLLRSPFGRVIVGIKFNEHRMRSLGYATFQYKLVTFVIAGALAGLAGYFDAAQFGFVSPELFGWRQSGIVLMMVILGGMGTQAGPIIGAFALILLQDFFADQAIFGSFAKRWQLGMGLFVIFIVLALPQGLGGLLKVVRKRRLDAGHV